MSADPSIHIKHLFISPEHNYFGHHGKPPGEHPIIAVPSIQCLAGRGIEGDRFLDFKEDYKGQITFFANEVYEEMCAKFGVRDRPPSVLRRNVITVGADLLSLIGLEFAVQGVRFFGTGECKPCYWMDQAFAPGAEEAMQGRGGLRAKILTDGILRAEGMTKSASLTG
jgi:MOSC domain-containing protein YiiM